MTVSFYSSYSSSVCILLQGLDVTEYGVQLISEMITGILGIEVSAMLGANIADEVSRDQYCEATIGNS